MAESDERAILDRYMGASTSRDLAAIRELQHPDYVEEWPQSGERIRGRENWRALLDNWPGGLENASIDVPHARIIGQQERWVMTPSFQMIKVSGSASPYTTVVTARYPDGSTWYVVSIIELRDEKVSKVTSFFAPVFEAPEWRSQWVEPIT
jgi:hypothetical protein